MRRAWPHPVLLASVSASVAATIVFTLGSGSAAVRSSPQPGLLIAAGARSGALAIDRHGQPYIAYVRGRALRVGAPRRGALAATLPRAAGYRLQLVVDHGGRATVLVQDRAGRWLGIASDRTGRWSWRVLERAAGKSRSLGPAGLALDAKGRPVVASASGTAAEASSLRVLRVGERRVSATGITRGGFPYSLTVPAATPVVLPDRSVHVVETFGEGHSVQALEWGRETDGWWGQVLAAGVFDRAFGPVRALVDRKGTVWSAWTAAGFGKSLVMLAYRRGAKEESTVVENASLAALALGPVGPELAVNGAGRARIIQAGRTVVTLDGAAADLAVQANGRTDVLLLRDGDLYLVRTPLP